MDGGAATSPFVVPGGPGSIPPQVSGSLGFATSAIMRLFLPLVTAVALVLACDGEPTAPRTPAALTVIVGGEPDSVLHPEPRSVTARVADARGRAVGGVTLRFSAGGDLPGPRLLLAGDVAQVEMITGADGTAQVEVVSAGTRAGEALLVVEAVAWELVDTALVVFEPGDAVSVERADAAWLTIGQEGPLPGRLADRHGNLLDAMADCRSESPDVLVVTDGCRGRGVAFGRGSVLVELGTARHRLHVGVLPAGTLAVTESVRTNGFTYIREIAGAELLRLPAAGFVEWAPDGGSLLASKDGRLHRLWLDGRFEPLFAGVPGATGEECPQATPGGWVHFRVGTPGGVGQELWRVRLDGQGAERLAADTALGCPSPSPDGQRVAYTVRHEGGSFMEVLSIETGASTVVAEGYGPIRWSPDGGWIALRRLFFLGGHPVTGIALVRPDGTPGPDFTNVGTAASFDWSPDAGYLVVRETGPAQPRNLWVLEVATGRRVGVPMQLVYSSSYVLSLGVPAWRP